MCYEHTSNILNDCNGFFYSIGNNVFRSSIIPPNLFFVTSIPILLMSSLRSHYYRETVPTLMRLIPLATLMRRPKSINHWEREGSTTKANNNENHFCLGLTSETSVNKGTFLLKEIIMITHRSLYLEIQI